jgi:hypothetical protein
MTLTVLRTFVETDLSDSALQVILDATNEDLNLAVGPDTSMLETVEGEGRRIIWLARPANSTFASITETDSEGTVVTLAIDDYSLAADGMQLTRLNTGTNPRTGWGGTVAITYTPLDLNKRNRALVQLVELDLAFRPGARSENVGDFSRTHQEYDKERARIISQAQSRTMA